MNIDIVEIKDMGTVSIRKPSTTAGLTSGYQKTNITTSGASFAVTTGGWMISEPFGLPSYEALNFDEPAVDVNAELLDRERCRLAEGYRVMAAKNGILAEEFLPAALEAWPVWGE